MSERTDDSIDFDDKQKQNVFETLISHIRFANRQYTKEDLKVDLVIRMPIPQYSYDLKSKQPEFNNLFKNTPAVYEDIYNLVNQYILYLVEKNAEMQGVSIQVVRTMTSLLQVYPEVAKRVRLDLQLEDPLEDGVGNKMDIDCKYEATDKIDTFMVKYNMLMIVLQRLCGFRVRSFILEDESIENKKGQKNNNMALYMLISLSTENLMKSADKYKLKKQISMSILDFLVNDPIDSKGRPIKINSFFKSKEVAGFNDAIKRLNADLGLSNKQFSDQVIDEAELSSEEIRKFQQYFQQLQYEVSRIFPPKQLKDKLDIGKGSASRNLLTGTNPEFNLRQTKYTQISNQQRQSLEKRYGSIPYLNLENADWLKMQGLDKLNKYQRQYIYLHNRHKINKGCEEKFLNLKKKKYLFEKIIELNKKYGYSVTEYKDSFVEFTLPAKQKAFFEKLEHMLKYEYYNTSPYGELTMFTNMERIKLAYLKIQEFVKIEQLDRMNMDIFTINNEYERFGKTQYEYDYNHQNQQGERSIPIHKPITKLEDAYSLNPLRVNLRAVRDYLGDNFAHELTFKIYLIIYLLFLFPVALGIEFAYHYYFRLHRDKTYLVSFAQLLILCFSYTIFIVIWQKHENKFFSNYIEDTNIIDIRAQYRGPYYRNFIDDHLNSFQTKKNLQQNIRANFAYLVLIIIFVVEAFYFGVIRKIIVAQYPHFPHWFIISFAHLTFYGVYFTTLALLYRFVLKKYVIYKLVNFQNYAKISEHEDAKRRFDQYYAFSLELIGPLFFLLIENINGTTCYADNCLLEFEHYVISRYILQIFITGMYNLYKAGKVFKYRFSKVEYEKNLDIRDQDIKKTFQYKLSKLLLHIQFQYTKEEVKFDLRHQLTIFVFFSIYFIRFAFCQVISLVVLVMDYYVKRTITFELKRRPITDCIRSYRYTPLLKQMYVISMLVNSFTIIFNDEFMEYDMNFLYSTFVPFMNQAGMLTFKLFVAVFLVTLIFILTLIFAKVGNQFGASKDVQKRKIHKFKQFLKKASRKPVGYRQTANPRLMKTIFYTYVIETVIQYKKNKFNFLKKKLRGEDFQTLPSESFNKLKMDQSDTMQKTKHKKADIEQNTLKNTVINDSFRFTNKHPRFQRSFSKNSQPQFNHGLRDTIYKTMTDEAIDSNTFLKNRYKI